jgi:DNA-binding IclR family transcriptional regulator
MPDAEKDEDSRQGVQSIEVGVPLLQALAEHGAPMMLRDLALRTGMPAAKAHRYLVSFVRTGLVVQDSPIRTLRPRTLRAGTWPRQPRPPRCGTRRDTGAGCIE